MSTPPSPRLNPKRSSYPGPSSSSPTASPPGSPRLRPSIRSRPVSSSGLSDTEAGSSSRPRSRSNTQTLRFEGRDRENQTPLIASRLNPFTAMFAGKDGQTVEQREAGTGSTSKRSSVAVADSDIPPLSGDNEKSEAVETVRDEHASRPTSAAITVSSLKAALSPSAAANATGTSSSPPQTGSSPGLQPSSSGMSTPSASPGQQRSSFSFSARERDPASMSRRASGMSGLGAEGQLWSRFHEALSMSIRAPTSLFGGTPAPSVMGLDDAGTGAKGRKKKGQEKKLTRRSSNGKKGRGSATALGAAGGSLGSNGDVEKGGHGDRSGNGSGDRWDDPRASTRSRSKSRPPRQPTAFEKRLAWLFSPVLKLVKPEAHSIAPLKTEDRTDPRFWSLFTLWLSMNMTIAALSAGTLGPAIFRLDYGSCVGIILGCNALSAGVVAYIATWGPKLGMRQMCLARYAFGYLLVALPALFNLASMIGFCIINAIVGGQALVAASSGSLSTALGIVLVALISLIISFAGYRTLHIFERVAWFPLLVAFAVLAGVAGSEFHYAANPDPTSIAQTGLAPGDPTDEINQDLLRLQPKLGTVLSFLGLIIAFSISWSPLASDFNTYMRPEVSSKKIALYTFAGLYLPCALIQLLGATLAAAALGSPQDGAEGALESWRAPLATGNIGDLVGAALGPVGGFGKFLLVIFGLGMSTNNAPTTYSMSLNFQLIFPFLTSIPRFVFPVVATAIYLPVAIVGSSSYFDALHNFLALIGYWVVIFIAIILIEHKLVRSGDFDTTPGTVDYIYGAWANESSVGSNRGSVVPKTADGEKGTWATDKTRTGLPSDAGKSYTSTVKRTPSGRLAGGRRTRHDSRTGRRPARPDSDSSYASDRRPLARTAVGAPWSGEDTDTDNDRAVKGPPTATSGRTSRPLSIVTGSDEHEHRTTESGHTIKVVERKRDSDADEMLPTPVSPATDAGTSTDAGTETEKSTGTAKRIPTVRTTIHERSEASDEQDADGRPVTPLGGAAANEGESTAKILEKDTPGSPRSPSVSQSRSRAGDRRERSKSRQGGANLNRAHSYRSSVVSTTTSGPTPYWALSTGPSKSDKPPGGWGGGGYDLSAWDSLRRLPLGVAALLACLAGAAAAVVCMDTTWYRGPVAKLAARVGRPGGDPGFGGDLGIEAAALASGVVYLVTRAVEKWLAGR